MATITSLQTRPSGGIRGFGRFLLGELKPRGPVLTPFNIVTGALILVCLLYTSDAADDLQPV